MLGESRLHHFLDQQNEFGLFFFEGHRLIHQLGEIHQLSALGLRYFADSVLAALPMIALLKPGEGLGVYIDSERPYFRLKIEANASGLVRTLLFPEDFDQFPDKLSGVARFTKILPEKSPYTSYIKIKERGLYDVINQILEESYQVDAFVKVSEQTHQSVMIMKVAGHRPELENAISCKEYWVKIQKEMQSIFQQSPQTTNDIISTFKQFDLLYLGETGIHFQCSCSKERMLAGIEALVQSESRESVFEGKESIEARCDYCKQLYHVRQDEVGRNGKN